MSVMHSFRSCLHMSFMENPWKPCYNLLCSMFICEAYWVCLVYETCAWLDGHTCVQYPWTPRDIATLKSSNKVQQQLGLCQAYPSLS